MTRANDTDNQWLEHSIRLPNIFVGVTPAKHYSSEEKERLTILNCIGNLMKGYARPFTIMPAQTAELPRVSAHLSNTLFNRTLTQIAQGVLPGNENVGQIRVGEFHVSCRDFYDTVLNIMGAANLFGEAHNESAALKNAMAVALGAKSFGQLETALQLHEERQALIAQREQLVANLDPVFTHMHQWFSDHVRDASARKDVFAADRAKSLDFERDILVWTQMERAMQPVEAALKRAVRHGALDENAIYFLGEKAAAHENALPGIKAWSAAAQGLLEAAQEVVRENLQSKPNDSELMLLMSVMERAEKARKEAEQRKPDGYPANATPSNHWAGQRPTYATPAAQPPIAS